MNEPCKADDEKNLEKIRHIDVRIDMRIKVCKDTGDEGCRGCMFELHAECPSELCGRDDILLPDDDVPIVVVVDPEDE